MWWPSEAMVAVLSGIAWKSTVVLAVAWMVAWLLRGSSAAMRHLIWTAAAAALLALPFLMTTLPALHLPVGRVLPDSGVVFRTVAGGASPTAQSSPRTAAARPATQSAPLNWGRWLALLWAAGTALGAMRMGVSWLRVWHMRRNAVVVTDGEMDRLREAVGVRQPVALLMAEEGVMPMACGVMHPAILLPAEATEWSAERRRIVLLHELAHVERGDLATHLVARTALLLHWWNPLAWLGWREFLKERERAADDLVLRMGTDAPGYASHLLDIARTMQPGSSMAVAMARRSELEGRMIAILDSKINRKSAGAMVAAAAVVAAVVIAAPLAALQAQESRTEPAVQNAQDGPGLLRQGQLQRRQGKREEAEATYRKALEAIGDKPEAVEALTALGAMAFTRKDLETAEHYLQKAQLLDPAKAGVAMMWMAMVRERENRVPEAESLFQAAIAIQEKNSQEAATSMELYAYLLNQIGRADEATLMKDRAMAIRKQVETEVYAAAPKPSDIHKIGGSVERPSLIAKVEPVYTDEARAAKYQGTVVLYVEIHPDGKTHNVRVLRGLGLGLNEQAMDAVSRWQFKPGTKDGQAVPVAATIEVNWRLL